VSAGKNIFALVQLENIGLRGKLMDVYLKLLITDLDKKILFESSKESIAVGTQLSTIRELNIPSYMPSGKYMLIAETSYDNTTIDAYDTFDIVEETTEEVVKEVTEEKTISTPGISLSDFLVVGFSVAIIIVCVMVFLLYREIKGLQIIYPVKSGKEIERERKKLKRKLKILKESFREGFINKEEYKKRKNEIKDKFEKLDKELERIKEEKIEYTEGELAVFRKEKNKLIDELKRLDKAYSLGVIDRKGYERTKNVINKKIDKLKEELGEF